MIYYAVLDGNNICIELIGLHEEMNRGNYIRLDLEDFSILGKKYNEGIWEDATIVPSEEPITDIELLMQVNADAELRDLEIQQNQEMLAQQMADIELALLGGVS